MTLLDSNVLSEIMRRQPHRGVVSWLDERTPGSLWTTAITVMEIRAGIEMTADPVLRLSLDAAFASRCAALLAGKVLSFDHEAAVVAGRFMGLLRRLRHNPDGRDVQIAAIAFAHGASLATRNSRHFKDLPIRIVDPWTAAPSDP